MKDNSRSPELADILAQYGNRYRKKNIITAQQYKVMKRIEICRTAALGGHIEACDHCGHTQNAYNSCRDRHCPKCQTMVKEKWLNDRKSELLPCSYFHNVFTLPHDLNPLIMGNKRILLALLFTAVKETLQVFARDPQWRLEGQLGFISVLHTWNQKLLDHYHLHCIIPAGALSFDRKKWVSARTKYLFKVQSLAKEFQKRYLGKLEKMYRKKQLSLNGRLTEYRDEKQFQELLKGLWDKQWITYAKQPFGGPEQVLEYLGRYTHRVAITNNRIIAIDNDQVRFKYRDRSDDNKEKKLTLSADEFIRRFLLHVLPNGFTKIRYYGFLAHANKKTCIELIRSLIGGTTIHTEKQEENIQEMMLRLTGIDICCCPQCGKGKLVYLEPIVSSDYDDTS
ncbi:IS91 family transposase [Desulfogranum marinum]|uniref:IS91 family transposase n=1 Tax=Desulfogranum marinum TaxID=453220 RepID=UPI0019657AB4|nr:IS91 family transposase [Desulfogranum marinum]MBM9515273.1 IS91 family transposase [Desulfogranum marinum]